MGKVLIVAKAEHLPECKAIMEEYLVALEINDFFEPKVLDSEERVQELIHQYQEFGVPEGSTLHGAFFDVVLFSYDARIQEISKIRMKQSMEIARKLGVKGVVFHTNVNPMLCGAEYDKRVVEETVDYIAILLQQYPEIEIYLENMFDETPDILVEISERLCGYPNYGVCLDYAHAYLYGESVNEWVHALASFVKHIHINDNDGFYDRHLAVGDGVVLWDEFAEIKRSELATCSMLIETTLPENQRRSLEYLEKNYKGMVERR